MSVGQVHNVVSYSGYTKGCKCDGCKAAAALYRRNLRAQGAPLRFPCWFCSARFATDAGRLVHQGMVHD